MTVGVSVCEGERGEIESFFSSGIQKKKKKKRKKKEKKRKKRTNEERNRN